MRILVTGVAGFIGFSLAKNLIQNKTNLIFGIDNLDDYYSVSLKKKRLNFLNKSNNFIFKKIDFTKKDKLEIYFRRNKFDYVMHFGAQAGVRYSIQKPEKYISNNFIGFANILELSRIFKIKKIIYASSSSVYGEQNKFPLKETITPNPKNIYAATKRLNEDMANDFSEIYKMDIIGLRLFTVYGEWGRPDMFIMKYLKYFFTNKIFFLNNSGNHYRDFTYIDDVVKIIEFLLKKKIDKRHKIFNICSNRPIKITQIIKIFDEYLGGKLNIKNIKINSADVFKTHGSNIKIKNFSGFKKFTKIESGLASVILWYKKNKVWNY
jgi:UDP-glucuronate 4-epimerase